MAENHRPAEPGIEHNPGQADDQHPAGPLERGDEVAHRLEGEERQRRPHVAAQEDPAPRASSGSWPRPTIIGSAYQRIRHIGGVTVAISHIDWRKVRRTSRMLFDRAPSAVAIIGEEAVTSPRQIRLSAKLG